MPAPQVKKSAGQLVERFRETLKKEIAFIPSPLRAIKGGKSKDLNPWVR
jgi:hypothetical protein